MTLQGPGGFVQGRDDLFHRPRHIGGIVAGERVAYPGEHLRAVARKHPRRIDDVARVVAFGKSFWSKQKAFKPAAQAIAGGKRCLGIRLGFKGFRRNGQVTGGIEQRRGVELGVLLGQFPGQAFDFTGVIQQVEFRPGIPPTGTPAAPIPGPWRHGG